VGAAQCASYGEPLVLHAWMKCCGMHAIMHLTTCWQVARPDFASTACGSRRPRALITGRENFCCTMDLHSQPSALAFLQQDSGMWKDTLSHLPHLDHGKACLE
jgi:hypothetical protein